MSSIKSRRKSSIQSIKSTRQISSPYLQSINDQLQNQVISILSNHSIEIHLTLSYQRSYKYVEFLCRDKQQSNIATFLFNQLDSFESSIFDKFINSFNHSNHIQVIDGFITLFDVVQSKINALEKIFLYLDRSYLLNHPTKSTISKHAFQFIHDKAFEQNDLNNLILESIIKLLNDYRTIQNESLFLKLSGLVIRFLKISDSSTSFDQFILHKTEIFYSIKHDELLNSTESIDIFDKMYHLVMNEVKLWERCNRPNTFIKRIKSITISQLLFKQFDKDGIIYIKPLFEKFKLNSLSKFFKFIKFSSNDSLSNSFVTIWSNYLHQHITTILQSNDRDIVEKLINSKKQLNKIVTKSFQSDSNLEFKLRETFQNSLNSKIDSNINLKLLKFIDTFYKNAQLTKHDENIILINDVFTIFKSIKSKENFLKLYQKDLSKRLIMSTSQDIPLEKHLVSLFESEVGSDISHFISNMFFDIEQNIKLVNEFHDSITITNDSTTDFQPLILNSKNWPIPTPTINLSSELTSLLSTFQNYYLSTHTKHQLKWCPSLSHMNITATFLDGEYDLQLSTFQGVVLLLFNDHQSLKYPDLKRLTGLDSKTLSSTLYSLTLGKYKILQKNNNAEYIVNEQFQDRKRNLRIRQIQMKLKNGEIQEDGDDDEIEQDQIDYSQDDSIKAYIIRFLKREGFVSYDLLWGKIQSVYNVGNGDFVRCLKQLVDLEFIYKKGDVYKYVP